MELFQDSNVWVLISFMIFMLIAYRYGRGAFISMLDNKINTIRDELHQAETLRLEAQDLLADYQLKHKDAMQEAKDIMDKARAQAEDIRNKAEADAKQTAKRREEQLNLKLQRIEQNARQEIEAYTAKLAIDAARDIMAKNMDSKTDKQLISGTIVRVSETLD